MSSPLAVLTGAGITVPLVNGGTARYVNLDYAASAPALAAVTAQVNELLPLYASVHRGSGYLSQACTAAWEAARLEIAGFTGSRDDDVVIITRNTTDALNLLASAVPGPVLHLDIEHHANLLPWRGRRRVAARDTVPATVDAIAAELRRSRAELLTVTGASNVTGECPPLAELAELAHRHDARLAVDGAQLAPHRRIGLAGTGIDYLAISGHKMYAPFGAGALIGRRDWLDAAPPYLAGGGAVREVTLRSVSWGPSPARHEAGTPNLIGAVALAAACRELAALDPGAVIQHETELLTALEAGLAAIGIPRFRLWPADVLDRVPAVTFKVPGYPAALVAGYLSAEHGIGVRDGRFCAHPLLARLNAGAEAARTGAAPAEAVRASLGLGSTRDDVDRLLTALGQLREHGPGWEYDRDGQPVPDPRPFPTRASAASGGSAAARSTSSPRGTTSVPVPRRLCSA